MRSGAQPGAAAGWGTLRGRAQGIGHAQLLAACGAAAADDGYKQRIAQQEQQIGGLEQQLFEHKRQAAEQLAALQGQLQDLQAVMQQLLQRQPAESE